MKKLKLVLLALLIIVSCFAAVSCKKNDTECVDGQEHYFASASGRCYNCGKDYCETKGGHVYEDSSGNEIDYCWNCGQTKSEAETAPIGTTIVVGLIALVVSVVFYKIGTSSYSAFWIILSRIVMFGLWFFSGFIFGLLCAIIMTVITVIYYVITVAINRSDLGYDGSL